MSEREGHLKARFMVTHLNPWPVVAFGSCHMADYNSCSLLVTAPPAEVSVVPSTATTHDIQVCSGSCSSSRPRRGSGSINSSSRSSGSRRSSSSSSSSSSSTSSSSSGNGSCSGRSRRGSGSRSRSRSRSSSSGGNRSRGSRSSTSITSSSSSSSGSRRLRQTFKPRTVNRTSAVLQQAHSASTPAGSEPVNFVRLARDGGDEHVVYGYIYIYIHIYVYIYIMVLCNSI